MFALSRDGERLFLHQPDEGMVVPVMLYFKNRKLAVQVPGIDELENDYAVYEKLDEVLGAVSSRHHDQVRFAGKFSRECSRLFREQLSSGKLTISALRKLVEDHVRRSDEGKSAARSPEAHPATLTQDAYGMSAYPGFVSRG